MHHDPIALADRFFTAVERADLETVRDLYDPNVIIWHNIDGLDKRDTGQTRDESLAMLEGLVDAVDNFHYDIWYREPTPTGFVQMHILRGNGPSGTLDVPVCLVCQITDGHITRIDEHLDSADTSRMLEALLPNDSDAP